MSIVYPLWYDQIYTKVDPSLGVVPNAAGKIYCYYKDTLSEAPIYNDNDSPASQPVVIASDGRAQLKLDSEIAYDIYIYDSNDVLLKTRYNVTSPTGGAGVIGGSGTAGKIAKFSDTEEITDSNLTEDGSGNVALGGTGIFTANGGMATNQFYLVGNLANKILQASDGLSVSDSELCSAGYIASKYGSVAYADGTTILGAGSVGDPFRTHFNRSGTTITQAVSGDDVSIVDGGIAISEDGEVLDIDSATGVSSSAGINWDILGTMTLANLQMGGVTVNDLLTSGDGLSVLDTDLVTAGYIDAHYLTQTDGDARYLKLDASNDPVTGDLNMAADIVPTTSDSRTFGSATFKWLAGYITSLFSASVQALTSAGFIIKNLSGATVATFGAGGGTGITTADGLNVGGALQVTTTASATDYIATNKGVRKTDNTGLLELSGGSDFATANGAQFYLAGNSHPTVPGTAKLTLGTSASAQFQLRDSTGADNSGVSMTSAGLVTIWKLLTASAGITSTGTITQTQNSTSQILNGNIYNQYTTVTRAGIVSGVSLAGTGVGSRTIGAGRLNALGAGIKVYMCGYYTTDGAPGNATFEIRIGATTFRTTGSFALDSSNTNSFWRCMFEISTRTTGATGTVGGQVVWEHQSSNIAGSQVMHIENMTSVADVTVDLTASQTIDALWTATDSGTSITCTCFSIEMIR